MLLTLWLTFTLAGGRKNILPAFLATALVATYPPLLGHAGLATTDLAAVATVLGFLLAHDRWTDAPSKPRAAMLGVALALASLCKLTAPLLCAVLGLAWLCGRRWSRGTWLADEATRWRELVTHIALAAFAALVVIWAGYRFSIGRLDDLPAMDFMGTPQRLGKIIQDSGTQRVTRRRAHALCAPQLGGEVATALSPTPQIDDGDNE